MLTIDYPSQTLTRLSDAQRKSLQADLDRDGFVVLPGRLPDELLQPALDAIDRHAKPARAKNPPNKPSVKLQNIVDLDLAFMNLMMYEPALQMAYDCFGPMFQLNQSNLVSRPRDPNLNDFVGSSPWHADGPWPASFPKVEGVVGMHYLKFGYFLTDLTHHNGGSLQVVRGTHKLPARNGLSTEQIKAEYGKDFVQIDCPAGTVIAFHQAQWHAAPPNESDIERKNCYISYCGTWMRPFDRDPLPKGELRTDLSDVERWLLGEYRPPTRWWLPTDEETRRMAAYAPDSSRGDAFAGKRYD
jgi:hypothetical protein